MENKKAIDYVRTMNECREALTTMIITKKIEPVTIIPYDHVGYFAKLTYNIGHENIKISLSEHGWICDHSNLLIMTDKLSDQIKEFVFSYKQKLLELQREALRNKLSEVEKKLGAGE